MLAVGLSLAFASIFAFGLHLDLVGLLVGQGALTSMQGRAVTALALGGGSAPAHGLIRLIEEAKNGAKEGRAGPGDDRAA